ncbi:MAG TPA: S24/S26 family peptidase [Anaerolineales bacterium]
MLPLLRPGDEVLVQPGSPPDLRRGDLVTIDADPTGNQEGRLPVTHRIVGRGVGGWLTKGDHCRFLDPPLPEQAILGRVVALQRAGSEVDLQTRRWKAANRILGLWGWWEVQTFDLSRRLYRSLAPAGPAAGAPAAGALPAWTEFLARCLAAPFRLVTWLVAGRR